MKNQRLSHILFLSKIITILLLAVPFLVAVARLTPTPKFTSTATATFGEETILNLSQVDHAFIVVVDKKRACVLVYDDGREFPSFESLSDLVGKNGLRKISGSIAVNPSKACYYIENGKVFIKTINGHFRVSRNFWNINLKKQLGQGQCLPGAA